MDNKKGRILVELRPAVGSIPGKLRPAEGMLRPVVVWLRPPMGRLRPAASRLRPVVGILRQAEGRLRPVVGRLRPAADRLRLWARLLPLVEWLHLAAVGWLRSVVGQLVGWLHHSEEIFLDAGNNTRVEESIDDHIQ